MPTVRVLYTRHLVSTGEKLKTMRSVHLFRPVHDVHRPLRL